MSSLRVVVIALGGLLVSGCASMPSGGGHDESLAGYALLLVMLVLVALGVALFVLAVGAILLAASGVTIAWNLVRPHWLGRVLGVLVGVADTITGAALLAFLFSQTVQIEARSVSIDLEGHGGVVGTLAVILLLLGPASFLAAIAPARPPTAARSDGPPA
ncbi:MAG: hypothetical protein U0353_08295 [Sandaracinus sp.]